eukprot:m.234881 g.234881  ORF g.234881 m.234881 type:complete len:56 (+) comp54307_c0_seq30:452-619(+)
MNSIQSLDQDGGLLTCQAGVILEKADHYLKDFGLMMPLDLGAKARYSFLTSGIAA